MIRTNKRSFRGRRPIRFEVLEARQVLAAFIVTNTSDSGAGSLRQAILDANAAGTSDQVMFAIPGVGPHVIQPLSDLPDIVDTIEIDGFTQPGSSPNTNPVDQPINAVMQIVVDGSLAPGLNVNGFCLGAGDGSVIRGLVVQNFSEHGIEVRTNNNRIEGNFIGVDVAGEAVAANLEEGVSIFPFTDGNTVGGTTAAARNLISGNAMSGVRVALSTNTVIRGNFIGTDKDGVQDLGNGDQGISLVDSDDSLVGGVMAGAGNRIAFNGNAGVAVFAAGAGVDNQIVSNSIFSNGGLGIDLDLDGFSPNDAGDPDIGANLVQNFPEFTGPAALAAGMVTVTYSIDSLPVNSAYPLFVQIFRADADGQEGESLVATNLYSLADFPGTKSFSFPAGALNPGDALVATATDINGNTSEFSLPVLIGLPPDRFEPNNTIAQATVLGSVPEITLNDLSIHSASDLDFFKVTAHSTGSLVVNLLFEDAVGDLDLRVLDMSGDVIASSASTDDNENLVIPVVSQQMYFVEVLGVMGAINTYSLEIENFPAPVPTAVRLATASDTGMMSNDQVTADDTPQFLISADLSRFQSEGITLLDAAQAAAGNIPGAGVQVTIIDVDTGNAAIAFADPIGPTGRLWSLNSPLLTDGDYLVTAATVMVDGQTPPVSGTTVQSPPLMVTIDTTLPVASPPLLLAASDSGSSHTDGVTNIRRPAFQGVVDGGSKVRIFARSIATGLNELVGQGVANANGSWEITVEPLNDGTYEITQVLEDLAGNVSEPSLASVIVIDTALPNTPYLDLLSDDGLSTTDNITSVVRPLFSFTVNDTPDGDGNPFPNDLKFRLYVRPQGTLGTDEVLVVDSDLLLGGLTSLGFLDRIVTLTLNDPTGTPYPNGVHGFKLEVEDRAGNISPDYLLNVEFDADPPVAGDPPDLLDSSDTGMLNDDDVTNKMEPAFNGISEVGARVTLFAQPLDADNNPVGANVIVGTGFVGSDQTDGNPADGMGVWEITSEPLDDGSYDITALIEDAAGGFVTTPALQIWIDTAVPNTPYLDLLANSDSGRSDVDNITNVNRPTVSVTANDTVDGDGNPFPNDLKYRIYVRPDGDLGQDEILLVDSFAALGDFTTGGFFTHTLSLLLNSGVGPVIPDGVHNFKLEVEDRAGNISPDFLLEVTVDTVAPATPTIQLDPLSDSGVQVDPVTLADRVTHDTDPRFVGRAEADAIVRLLSAGANLGTTVAVPFDGNDALPDGQWNLATLTDVNDPAFFTRDGARTIQASAQDVAGNTSNMAALQIVIDTQGAQIASIHINSPLETFNLFALKPSTEGPTPLVNSLVLSIRDLPNRLFGFQYDAVVEAIAENPALYSVVGDHSGTIPIVDVIFVQDPDPPTAGAPAAGTITLLFAEPLPDDRFTLSVSERLVDPANNTLQDVDGGVFVRRFTVDSRPEIGTWAGGSVYLDTNGNFLFDPENADDDVNEDLTYAFATPGDDVFAGNFVLDPEATADGFDKVAAYGDVSSPSSSTGFRWKIDFDHDGVADVDILDPSNINGLPVSGRFDPSNDNGDEVGLFTGTVWYFDTNHDFRVDFSLQSQLRGYPMAGDFNGDGFDDLGTYNEQEDRFEFDLTTGAPNSWDGSVDQVAYFGFAGVRERPVAADMNRDGIDDFGLWVPDRSGVTAGEAGEWFIFVSNGETTVLDRIAVNPDDNLPSLTFQTVPFGNDIFAQFGDEFALPVLGNFDPPLRGGFAWTNLENPLDVNGDRFVSPIDALLVINQLGRVLPAVNSEGHYYDVNGDGVVAPLDALEIINNLGSAARAPQSVAVGGSRAPDPLSHDAVMADRGYDPFQAVLGDLTEDVPRG